MDITTFIVQFPTGEEYFTFERSFNAAIRDVKERYVNCGIINVIEINDSGKRDQVVEVNTLAL